LPVALRLIGVGALAAALLLETGCQPPPPVQEERHEASVPAVPPIVRRATPRVVVRTNWTFSAGDEECTAVAAAGGNSLAVTVRRDAPIRVAVTVAAPAQAPATTQLRFSGPAGTWQAAARRAAPRQVAVSLGADETALSRVLVLLSGGTLEVGTPTQLITTFNIGPSEAQGQDWFDCARAKAL
jgi:hypothetical protein